MLEASSVISPLPASTLSAPPPLLCTWKAGSCASWVHVAGKLDRATSRQLARTLAEAQLTARLLMLDLRELTFIDSSAVDVIVDAAVTARRRGGRLMLARGPAEVDRVFTLTGACDQVLIIDLYPGEPSRTLLEVA